jgi:hypothetical protein
MMEVTKMEIKNHKSWWLFILFVLSAVMFVLSGCATVGPRTVSQGRAGYNEAINRTEDEQMLLSIVKGRYGETFSLLAVSGVAANVRFRSTASVDFGFGPSEGYAGNLIPFRGGLIYEENPTITYAPVKGEQYVRNLLSPIPPTFLLLAIRTGLYTSPALMLYVNRINELLNPDFLETPEEKPDPRFQRFVELSLELNRADVVHWVRDPRQEIDFDILITNFAPAYTEKVREFLSLIGKPMPADESQDIILPVYFTVKAQDLKGVAITTRSTGDMIQILRAAVQVLEEHSSAGLAIEYPPMGPIGEKLHIYSSKDRPTQAILSVKHRGYWFYIDDRDLRTKYFYSAVRTLWGLSIAASDDPTSAPVLTLPVSR